MINIFVGIFCLATAGCMLTLALMGGDDSPRWLFALLAIVNASLGVLNLATGLGGGA